MVKISVVLPIYNAEQYLKDCFESIRAQTMSEIEVLCVNDGSTDSSLSIIEDYASMDSRFVVLDKPNGGYGKAVNYGIDRAKGEYISIVEPDDFLDPEMFEVLYGFAHKGQDKPVDVVKGSYWEYFDECEGRRRVLARPVLDACMPDVPKLFKLNDDPDVFKFHPSIWSAIYRRDFLVDSSIRFVEPAGAGWADNPFLAQTLVLAESIWWVPIRGYYYRQTNASASSFLKDVNVPFNRLREMREFLSRQSVSDDVKAVFYFREFNYIYDVIHAHRFSERDPAVKSLIDETLVSMDESIVLRSPIITPHQQQYYQQALGAPIGVAPHSSEDSPVVTVVVPVKNGGVGIAETISSVVKIAQPFECLTVFYGGNDRSYDYCKKVAGVDARFRVIDGLETEHAALNRGIEEARGTYFVILEPNAKIDPSRVSDAVEVMDANAQIGYAAFYASSPVRDRIGIASAPRSSADKNSWEEFGSIDGVDLSLHGCSNGFFLAHLPYSFCDYIVRSKFARHADVRFDESDGAAGFGFASQLMKLGSPHFFGYLLVERDGRGDSPVSKYPAVFPEEAKAWHRFTADAFSLEGIDADIDGVSVNDWENLALRAFVLDINEADSVAEAKDIYETFFARVDDFVSARGRDAALYFYDVDAFRDFEFIRCEGILQFFFRKHLLERNDATFLGKELREDRASLTFRVGNKIVFGAKRLLPAKLVSVISNRSH